MPIHFFPRVLNPFVDLIKTFVATNPQEGNEDQINNEIHKDQVNNENQENDQVDNINNFNNIQNLDNNIEITQQDPDLNVPPPVVEKNEMVPENQAPSNEENLDGFDEKVLYTYWLKRGLSPILNFTPVKKLYNKVESAVRPYLNSTKETVKGIYNKTDNKTRIILNATKGSVQEIYHKTENGVRPYLNVAVETTKNVCKYSERNLTDPVPDIIHARNRIEAAYNVGTGELSLWLANFLSKTVCNLMDEGWITSGVASVVGRERLADTVKVNVLELIANGLEVFDPEEIDFDEEEDSEPEIEGIGEGEHGQNAHSIDDNELFDELIEQNPNAEARQEAPANISDTVELERIDELELLNDEISDEEVVKPNPFVKLVDILKDCLLIHNEELKQISSLKERAEIERLRAQAELNAFAGYEHRNSVYNQPANEKRKHQAKIRKLQALAAFRDVLEKPALQLTCQEQRKHLKYFVKYLKSNKAERDQYVAEVKAEFERASQEIETQIEHRKKIFAEQITPRILSIFLPKGPESIKIYSSIDQKEFFFLRIAQENIHDLVQAKAFEKIQSILPEQLFEFFPFIFQVNRPEQEALINANPHSAIIWTGINLLSEDVVNLVTDKLEIPAIAENDFKDFIKPYIEYVLMHAFNTFAQLDPQLFIQLVEIVGEIRSKIAKNENAFESLIKAFELLTDQEKNNLFGLPSVLTKVLNKKIVEDAGLNICKYLIYPLQQLKAQKIVDLPEGSIAGTSVKVNALSHAIYVNLEAQINKQISNAKMMGNGYSKIVNLISEGVGKALAKKKEPFVFVGFLGELIQTGMFNSLLHGAIDLTHTQPARPLKVQLLFMLKPILTNFAVKGLTPLLEKEKQGGREFDKSLLMTILPLIKDHLKQLNQPLTDQQKDFQARANAVKAVNCYTDLSQKLVNLLLPRGVRDLQELFPALSEKDLQLVLDLTNEIPSVLASIKGSVFDTEVFRDICISVYENAIDTFKQIPIHSTPSVGVALTREEKVWQDQLDAELEELIYEVAKLTDLPVVKLLKMARLVPGHQSLRRSIIKSTREAILKKLKNGDLVEKLIKSGLDSQQKMKTDKPDGYYQNKLDRLEHQFVVEGVLYGLRSAFESVHKALQALDYPVLKQVKDAVESLCRFIIVRIVGGLLSITGIDNWLLNTAYEILKRNRIRIQTEFAKPAKHEVVAIDLIQAGERVLMRDWTAHPQ